MYRIRAAARLSALLSLALGAPARGAADACAGPLSVDGVVRCAVQQDLEVHLAQRELRVLAGRRVTAGTWLPSHPTATLSLADRRLPSDTGRAETAGPVLNWYVTLSQEIEIAGQRRARLDAADAELAAQVRRVAVAEQEAMAAALSAYYDLLGAREELRLAGDLASVAQALGALGAGRAREGLLSPVEAEVAQAEAAHILLGRFEAERRLAAAEAALSVLLGLAVLPAASFDLLQLPPLPAASGPADLFSRALVLRGEVAAAEMERTMRLARVRLLQRSRVPNLTLSFLAQRDGFDERVLGGGLSLPLYLPSPVGPGGAGEVQAARAEAEQAGTRIAQIHRRVQAEVARGWKEDRSYVAALDLFPAERIDRAREGLRAIARAIAGRQLPLREALLSQRSLIELLSTHIRTRVGLAQARVELLRVTGLLTTGARP